MKVMNARLVGVARRLDFLWNLLGRLASPRPLPDDSPVSSILVVDLHLVGDIVMLTPLLKALRERHPSAHIALLAGPWAIPVLAGAGTVDAIIPYSAPWAKSQPLLNGWSQYIRTALLLRSRRFDVGIDVRGDIRQILLIFLARCRRRVGFAFTGGAALLTDVVPDDGTTGHILGHHERIAAELDAWDGREFVPTLSLTEDEQRDAATIAPFVGFHLGASLPLRRLPPRDAASLIGSHPYLTERLVLFSAADMEDYTSEVISMLPTPVAGKVVVWRGDLRNFIVMTSRAKRMYTVDSGPAHVAAALGRETIVFFGPNLPRYTGPRGPKVHFVEDTTVPCRPCDQRHCVNSTHQACLLQLVPRALQIGRDVNDSEMAFHALTNEGRVEEYPPKPSLPL